MDSLTKLAQNDGKASTGKTVTNYTVKLPIAPQVMVPNKTPMHSRTQPLNTTPIKK